MTDKEQIAMLRAALKKTYAICSGASLTKSALTDALRSAKKALAATAPSAQGQEKVDERAALKALVEAKDYKEKYGKDQAYELMQFAAWEQARAALRSE